MLDAPVLMAHRAGTKALYEIKQDACITTSKHGAVIKIFDPIDFVSNPFENTQMQVFYAAADPTDAKAIVDSTAEKTTQSEIVFVRKAEVKAFSGQRPGCTIESGLGGSQPGTLFFQTYKVEGC